MSKKFRNRSYMPRMKADYPTVYADQVQDHYDYPAQTAMIYRSEMDYISRCILDYPDIETGGQLFGFWTGAGVPVVLYAIGPGPNANHEHSFFNQDVPYLQNAGQSIIDRFGLQHIGEWHSHHMLGLDHPSGHDARTMITSIQRLDLQRFLLCIGNYWDGSTSLNAYTFHRNCLQDYDHAAWNIIEQESPFRPIIDRDLRAILVHPRNPRPCLAKNYIVLSRPSSLKPMYDHNYWLRDKANNPELKKIIDFLLTMTGGAPSVKIDEHGHVHVFSSADSSGNCIEIYFPEMFPDEAPDIYIPKSMRVSVPGIETAAVTAADYWQSEGAISERVITCLQQMQGTLPPPINDEDFAEEVPANEPLSEETIAEKETSADRVSEEAASSVDMAEAEHKEDVPATADEPDEEKV